LSGIEWFQAENQRLRRNLATGLPNAPFMLAQDRMAVLTGQTTAKSLIFGSELGSENEKWCHSSQFEFVSKKQRFTSETGEQPKKRTGKCQRAFKGVKITGAQPLCSIALIERLLRSAG
jgi:hypothetical protein